VIRLARHAGGAWQAPQHLPAPINSRGWDFGPRLAPDGRWFLFTSNRGFADEPLPRALDYDELEHRLHGAGNGLRDIYVVDSGVLRASSAITSSAARSPASIAPSM
jgi:Tol biopolymer transport system component